MAAFGQSENWRRLRRRIPVHDGGLGWSMFWTARVSMAMHEGLVQRPAQRVAKESTAAMSRTQQDGSEQQSCAAATSGDKADTGKNQPADDLQKIMRVLLTSRGRKPDDPITAERFLEIAGRELGPFFHASSLGPIPDYLQPHYFVHQCVAEYEDRLEALDQWKARQLSLWLEKSIGEEVVTQGKIYRLRATQSPTEDATRFWFEII
jgi:hypothetical protein